MTLDELYHLVSDIRSTYQSPRYSCPPAYAHLSADDIEVGILTPGGDVIPVHDIFLLPTAHPDMENQADQPSPSSPRMLTICIVLTPSSTSTLLIDTRPATLSLLTSHTK